MAHHRALPFLIGLLAASAARADFLERGAALGIADSTHVSTGLAWADFDRDGDQDLLVAAYDGPLHLYRNDGGTALVEVTNLGLAHDPPYRAMGAAWADFDKDGDLDLYVARNGRPNLLFRRAFLGFIESGAALGVADSGRGTAAAWVDLEPDGDLDLYVANRGGPNRCYRNDNPGARFVEVGGALGIADPAATEGFAFGDYDADGDPDLFLSNFDAPHRLLRNDGAAFADVSATAGIRPDGIGQGAAWADFDGDGDLDLAQTLCVEDRLYRNDGGGAFAEVGEALGIATPGESRGAAWADYDLDGRLDLLVGRVAGRPLLFRGMPGGFVEVGESEGLLRDATTYGAAWGDLDGDLVPDLALASAAGPNRLYLSRGRSGHALAVALSAFAAPREGIGARVRAVAGGISQLRAIDGGSGLLAQAAPIAAFGLGAATRADTLEIRWPRGVQVLTDLAADSLYRIEEDVVDSVGVTLLGFLPIPNYEPWVADVWGYETADRDYALVCAGDRLVVADVTDPSLPSVAALVPSAGRDLKDVATYRTHAYCVNEDGPIQVVDLSVPEAAFTAAQIGEETGYHTCFVDTAAGKLYAAGFREPNRALHIFDLAADPLHPPLLATYGDFYGHDMHARDGRVLVFAIFNGFFELLDVSDPAAPRPIARMSYPDAHPHSGWFSADCRYAFVCDEAAGGHLRIWDLADTLAIRQVAEYEVDPRSSIHDVHVRGGLAYVSYYDQGIRILDVRVPESPVEVGHFRSTRFANKTCSFSVFSGVWGVYPHTRSGNVYFADMCGGGLYVARRPAGFGSPPADEAPAAAAGPLRLDPAWPNPLDPARGGQIELRLPSAGPVRLEVFDVAGRLVRHLMSGALPAGTHLVSWDGRDESGRPAPSGIYLTCAITPGGAASRRIVVLR